MGGPSLATRGLVAAALVLVAIGLMPSTPVRGADSPPPEPGVRLLDGPSLDGLTADLDGDSRPEVIRLTPWDLDSDWLAIDVWQQEARGAWASVGELPLQRRQSPEERAANVGKQQGFAPVALEDGARLLRFRVDGRDHVLVAVTHRQPGGLGGTPCCLTGWLVGLRNGSPALSLEFSLDIGASSVLALDMDSDGMDELVVRADGLQGPEIHVLHWDGRAFADTSVRRDPGNPGDLVLLGDSDGRPGDEAALAGRFESGTGGVVYSLMRVSLRDGRIHVEQEEVDRPGMALAVPTSDGSRARIAYGNDESELAILDWPSDGTPRVVTTASVHGQPIAVLGSGAGQRIVIRSLVDGFARYRLIDASLDAGSVGAIEPSAAAAPLRDDAFAPYAGPWPAALGGAPSFVVAGRQLAADTAGRVSIQGQVAALSGTVPLGLVGERDQLALLQTVQGDPFEPAGLPRDRGGDMLVSQSRRIAIVPLAQVETPERDGGRLTPAVLDAVRDPSVQDHSALLIQAPAFVAALDAPIGSIVRTDAGGAGPIKLLDPATIPPDGGSSGGPPFRAEVVWASSDKTGRPFTATLWLATPGGHAYTATWQVRLLPQRPHVSAEGALVWLGFGAGLSGQTDPGSSVSVDGRAIETDASGHFEATAPASLLPREVQVVATDPFGRRTTIEVSVVAPLDYRRLPWIPIAALGTVAAGFVLFLRAPRARPRPVEEAQAGDAVLEEIDGDRI